MDLYSNLNGQNVAQLLGARLHNVDNAAEATLAGALGAANEGLVIYNTETETPKYWDGTAFQSIAAEITGDVIFRGVLAATDYDQNDGGYTTGPEFRQAGSQYVIGEAGTLDIDAVTTYVPNAVVQQGDQILFTATDTVYVVQRNVDQATDATLGNVRLATEAEVLAGTEDQAVVTPDTLQAKLDQQGYSKGYFTDTATVVAGVPLNINHGLGLVDKDAFICEVKDSTGSKAIIDTDGVDTDNLTITSLVSDSNLHVTVIGLAAAA